jgi:hypothetical protein
MPIHVTTSTTQSLSNKTFVDRVSTTGVVYADSGNSNQWSSTYNTVYATSATWDSTYTTLNSNSAKYESSYTTLNANSAKWDKTIRGSLGITIDGAGSTISTGSKGFVRVPYSCTITGAELVADRVGSIVVDVLSGNYSNFPPAVSIVGSSKPTLSSTQKSQTTVTSWLTALNEGDYLGFNVDSSSTLTRVILTIITSRVI